jgi:hypothetical protein
VFLVLSFGFSFDSEFVLELLTCFGFEVEAGTFLFNFDNNTLLAVARIPFVGFSALVVLSNDEGAPAVTDFVEDFVEFSFVFFPSGSFTSLSFAFEEVNDALSFVPELVELDKPFGRLFAAKARKSAVAEEDWMLNRFCVADFFLGMRDNSSGSCVCG